MTCSLGNLPKKINSWQLHVWLFCCCLKLIPDYFNFMIQWPFLLNISLPICLYSNFHFSFELLGYFPLYLLNFCLYPDLNLSSEKYKSVYICEGILDASCKQENNCCTFFLFIYLIISYKLLGLNSVISSVGSLLRFKTSKWYWIK